MISIKLQRICLWELSSIDSKIEDLCDIAVNTLLKVINNEKVSKKQVIDCEFIERDSTKL